MFETKHDNGIRHHHRRTAGADRSHTLLLYPYARSGTGWEDNTLTERIIAPQSGDEKLIFGGSSSGISGIAV